MFSVEWASRTRDGALFTSSGLHVIPAKAGNQRIAPKLWTPACAGVTEVCALGRPVYSVNNILGLYHAPIPHSTFNI